MPNYSDYYKPFPKQLAFHNSQAKYRLFGGAAGPGKTKALLWEAIRQANKFAGVDTLLLRRTYPELESSLLNYFRRDIPRDMYRSFNDSKHVVTWHNGSTTRFGYCASENDVYQYQGAEFLFIGFDELTHFTLKQWDFLTARNRCPIPGTHPNMAGCTNPGNIGHAWVKALWIDRKPAPGMESADQYDANDYEFIPALIADNPIYANDQSYLKTLSKLPKWLREALLRGDWDVFAGQYFDIWNPQDHVGRVESFELQPWNPRWMSIDWGFKHDSAIYWHATLDDGRNVTYREFVQHGLSPRMLATAIVERTPKGEKILDIYTSPDAFAERTSESTIAEQMNEILVPAGFPECSPADDDRVGGWMLMYQLLETKMWQVASNCERLIASVPSLVRDDKHVEDVKKVDGDDPADSARYGMKSRLSPGKVPVEVVIARRVEKIADPTSRAIFTQKLQHEAKKHAMPVRRRPARMAGTRF